MPTKSVTPSIRETAFDCPHCGAYTTQTWYDVYAHKRPDEFRTPMVDYPQMLKRILLTDKAMPEELKDQYLRRVRKLIAGLLVVDAETKYIDVAAVSNLHLSHCFNCDEFSVWIYDRLVFPAPTDGPPANPDLPESVCVDYQEAGKILNLSPRGAAALLRLAIQKLCVALGERGDNLNEDIAILVRKGLPTQVQMALDAVRVIGNESVHPGTIDLRDDPGTANKLFELVNIIAEQMISNPKHVEEIYKKIPEEKRKAIEKRDGLKSS